MAGIQIDGVNNKIDFDDDADTSISSATDDTLVIESGGVNIASITSGEFAINEGSADIDFRVESNANANALHVDGGNSSVGINTTGPSDATLEIHDSVSIIKLQDTDDNTFSRMYHSAGNFLIDVDKGNSGSGTFFQLGIDDTRRLKMLGGNAITMDITSGATTDTTAALQLDKADESASTSTRMIGFIVGGQGRGFILNGTSDSGSPSFGAGSDRRLKKNITAYTGGYDKIKSIPVQTWDEQFTDATGVKGWIADELETVFPDAVTGTKDATKTVTNAIISEHGNCLKDNITEEEFNELKEKGKYANCTWSASKVVPAFQMSSPLQFFPDVVQALQAAITRIETLETKVAALEGN